MKSMYVDTSNNKITIAIDLKSIHKIKELCKMWQRQMCIVEEGNI